MDIHKLFVLAICFCCTQAQGQFGAFREIGPKPMSHRQAIAFDCDGDSDLDIFLNASTSKEIVWYENLGDGLFSESSILVADNVYSNIDRALGDMDLDGDLDIVTQSELDGRVLWFENDGTGSFLEVHQVTDGTATLSVKDVADLDGDGDYDIITYAEEGFDGVISWIENYGDGNFSEPQLLFSSSLNIETIEALDFNQDGLMDLAIRMEDGFSNLRLLTNLGDLNFASMPNTFLQLANQVIDFRSGDIDNDGDIDICAVISDGFTVFRWWEQTEEGEFELRSVDQSGDYEGGTLELVDIDNDGDLDIIGSYYDVNSGQNVVALFEYTGDSPFAFLPAQPFEEDWAVNFLLATDVTGNENKDLIGISYHRDQVTITENLGNGEFGPRRDLTNNFAVPSSPGKYDFNDDGHLDILAASRNNAQISYLPNDGNGNFGNPVHLLTGTVAVAFVHLTDFDNDGDEDILWISNDNTSLYKVYWSENLGDYSFESSTFLFQEEGFNYLIFDTDLDGDDDIVFDAYSSPFLQIAENMGDGTVQFVELTGFDPGSFFSKNYGDIDGDGDDDIIVRKGSPYYLTWYENLGEQQWGAAQVIDSFPNTIPASNAAPELRDMDSDGDLDLISYNKSGLTHQVSYYENLGDGAFGQEQILYSLNMGTGVDVLEIGVADANDDGSEDIVVFVRFENKLIVIPNNGNGGFGEPMCTAILPRRLRNIQNMDMDGDGDIDLFGVVSLPNQLYVIENLNYHPHEARGRVYLDENQNGMPDSAEVGLNFINIVSQPESEYAFTYDDGVYRLLLGDADQIAYDVSVEELVGWELTSDESSYVVQVDEEFDYVDNLDFGFYPDSFFTDLEVDLIGGFPRCNTVVNYWINVSNVGTNLTSGLVHLELDELLVYAGSGQEPDSIVGNNIYWHFDSLFYFSDFAIEVQVQMPTFEEMGSFLNSELSVTEMNNVGDDPFSEADGLFQIVSCAYDPNDKSVEPVPLDSLGYISLDDELTYLIRFQNTGNDTAISVIIEDQLSDLLDYSTFEPVASSHEMQVSLGSDGHLEFAFYHIMLPDSNVDFLGSQGFVEFRITPLPGLVPNTEILNTAEIYFDYNPAIVTNTVQNTIECYIAPEPSIIFSYPFLYSGVPGAISYQWYLNDIAIPGAVQDTYVPNENGFYSVEVEDENGCLTLSQDFDFNSLQTAERIGDSFSIFPNPSSGATTFKFEGSERTPFDLVIYNVIGIEVMRQANTNSESFVLQEGRLKPGLYISHIATTKGNANFKKKFVIQ